MAENYRRGTVRWFSARRGYGFLTDENGVDYFVHYSSIVSEGFKTLSPDEKVEFLAGEDGQGRTIARSVVPAGRGGDAPADAAGEEDREEP